jgi:mRNA-degrading endonuclease YafQ of YafQ-DinJ toxin-antitoxin module
MATPPKGNPAPEVKWELAPGFRETWKIFKAKYPDISQAMTEFNRCKRTNPPERLPGTMMDHKLDGPLKGFMDCHLAPDVILIYKNTGRGAIKLFTLCQHTDLKGPKAKTLAKKLK